MSLFCAGWTFIWLLLLPFGVFPEASWSALLPVFMMSCMMLGLEDAANQLEDPFRFFAYEAMAATTAKDMPRTVDEVQACKRMIQAKVRPRLGQLASMDELPPFPKLPPRPQRGLAVDN
jgi:predicted membrane chloride channel (bestrophin family)